MTKSALKEADEPGRGGVDRHPGRGGVDLGGHARWQLKSLEEMYVTNYRVLYQLLYYRVTIQVSYLGWVDIVLSVP